MRKRRAHGGNGERPVWLSSSELLKRVIKRQAIERPAMLKKSDLRGVVMIRLVINQGGRVISVRGEADNPLSTTAVRSLRKWVFEPYRLNGRLKLMAGSISIAYEFQDEDSSDCVAKLERAETYEIEGDPRAEQEFRQALSDGGKQCPNGLRRFSNHLSEQLRFEEAADALQAYINLTAARDRGYDEKDVKALRKAGRLKERVDGSNVPSLDDLLELIHTVRGYGRKHGDDALPYAETAVELYPGSVTALLYLTEFLSWKDKNRTEQLLNRAASIDPRDPRVFTARGLFYYWHHIKLDDAERDFNRALSFSNGTDDEAWKGLGLILMDRGQRSEAIRAFRNYLRLTKAAPEVAADVKTRLDELEKAP